MFFFLNDPPRVAMRTRKESLLGDVEECQTGRVEVYSYNSVASERDMSLELRFRFAEG